MGQVLIRNLDDALLAEYKRAAKLNARSLESELRDGLDKGRPRPRASADELTQLVSRLWAMTSPAAAQLDSTPFLRTERDRR